MTARRGEKLHVALLSQYYQPEQIGPAIWLKELASDLVAAGHRVTVLTGFPNHPNGVVPPPYRHRLFQKENLDGTEVLRTYVYATSSKAFWRRAANFGSFVFSSLTGGLVAAPRCDVIYATLPPLPLGVTAFLLARLKSARVVVNLQDIHPEAAVAAGIIQNPTAIGLFEGMERWVYQHSDRLVVISEGFRQNLLSKGVPESKIRIIPNWADPEFVQPGCRDPELRERWGRDKFLAVYSGGLTHNSNLEPVLQAAGILRDEPFQFVIIGEGVKKQKLEEMARVQQLKSVSFMPFQPLARYPKVLCAADINLVTLRRESATASVPSKIFKMMASGQPVLAIVPPESEIARLVEAARCGFVAGTDQPEQVAEMLRYASTHRDEIAQMGRRGRSYLEQNLARKIITGRVAQLLSEVVAEQNPRGGNV